MGAREKQVVHFIPSPFDFICTEHRAIIHHPLDHPSPLVSNTQPITTSPVVAIFGDGSFETQNSRYIPVKEDSKNVDESAIYGEYYSPEDRARIGIPA